MFAEMLRSISLTFCLPHAGVFASKCGDRRRAVDEEETIVLFLPGMVKYVLMSQPLLFSYKSFKQNEELSKHN